MTKYAHSIAEPAKRREKGKLQVYNSFIWYLFLEPFQKLRFLMFSGGRERVYWERTNGLKENPGLEPFFSELHGHKTKW